jgi:hypothetical protein
MEFRLEAIKAGGLALEAFDGKPRVTANARDGFSPDSVRIGSAGSNCGLASPPNPTSISSSGLTSSRSLGQPDTRRQTGIQP